MASLQDATVCYGTKGNQKGVNLWNWEGKGWLGKWVLGGEGG